MADMEIAADVLSHLAEKLALDTHRSVLVIVGDDEGSVVGACILEPELMAMATQLRLIADGLEEQAAVGMN